MNSDLKAQLRELNITAAKVGQMFLAKNLGLLSVLIFTDVIVLVEWCFLFYVAYGGCTVCCCSVFHIFAFYTEDLL